MTGDRMDVLTGPQWRDREAAHAARVRRFSEPFLARRMSGRKHPVEDFLFTYYNQKPAQLLRWHPGASAVLLDAAGTARAQWKFHRPPTAAELAAAGITGGDGALIFDRAAFLRERAEAVSFSRIILGRTAARPGHFGCFGLHEWAMVYKSAQNGVRHEYLPLRLGAAGTDTVVEQNRIRCTHFDAFRFYTPEAVPLNLLQPTRETQRELEQPGCLHANMDLYKWAYKLNPAVPSELVMDCFELSWRIREMDMRASPYELSDWGYAPIRIETPEGKAEYVRLQKGFAAESDLLRKRLLAVVEELVPED